MCGSRPARSAYWSRFATAGNEGPPPPDVPPTFSMPISRLPPALCRSQPQLACYTRHVQRYPGCHRPCAGRSHSWRATCACAHLPAVAPVSLECTGADATASKQCECRTRLRHATAHGYTDPYRLSPTGTGAETGADTLLRVDPTPHWVSRSHGDTESAAVCDKPTSHKRPVWRPETGADTLLRVDPTPHWVSRSHGDTESAAVCDKPTSHKRPVWRPETGADTLLRVVLRVDPTPHWVSRSHGDTESAAVCDKPTSHKRPVCVSAAP